jgi:hypothetical protein
MICRRSLRQSTVLYPTSHRYWELTQWWDERVIKDWVLDDANCGVAMRKTVAEAMAGRTVNLTTVEVGGETEQVGGSGRHMERER